jgi:hypothetical protein
MYVMLNLDNVALPKILADIIKSTNGSPQQIAVAIINDMKIISLGEAQKAVAWQKIGDAISEEINDLTNQPSLLSAIRKADLLIKIAKALLQVTARRPADTTGKEFPVLTSDPDFDDLPIDHRQGTEDDNITQVAVLRLAQAAYQVINP